MKADVNFLEEQGAIYEKLAERAVAGFGRAGIHALFVPSGEEALTAILDMIPEGATVGTADSITLVQLGVFPALRKRGKNEIINPFVRDETGRFVLEWEPQQEVMRKVLLTDVFVIGTNAVTLDGKLVNIDGHGNRVAPMIFGPKKVIIVVGVNKIVKDVDEALKRVREWCAPRNVLKHGIKFHRTNFLDLPCAKTGLCAHCRHPWSICKYTTIIEGEQEWDRGRLNVIIVGEELGL